jgi:FixJ family two-component response regulator
MVHLVDDDESCLRSTARMLAAEGFRIVTYACGAGLLTDVSSESRGCIVADLNMPGMDGLELQAALSTRGVLMPLVFLSGQGDIPRTVRAMRGGAVDFIEKLAPREQLFAAIRRALERDAAEHGQRARVSDLKRRFEALSHREQQVLREVLRGQMNKQIAATLGISERTVKLHRTSIKGKIGVHSAARLAALARDAGWTDDRIDAAAG